MILRKWSYEKQDYEDYKVPDDYKCKIITGNMDEMINCAQCGENVLFGNTYTSREIHSKYGFGYAVCEECYYKELARGWDAKIANEM